MDSHRIKNVLGELTFGEYWNVAGCHAYAVKLRGKNYSTAFQPSDLPEPCIRFHFENYGNIFIPLGAKAKVLANRVITHDISNEEITLDFYELTPSTGPFSP
jgi:hypothetical protein